LLTLTGWSSTLTVCVKGLVFQAVTTYFNSLWFILRA